MTDKSCWAFVVDDDASVRKALVRSIRSAGLNTESFSSAEEFLQYELPNAPSCLVLDVQMPQSDGFQLQKLLSEHQIDLPIIFITGHGDIPMTVRALKAGAVDFLPKPLNDSELLSTVRRAIEQNARDRVRRSETADIERRVNSLSPREREVLDHVVGGSLNKQIGRRLGVTEKTIKVHRGHIMQKMKAGSLAELVHMADRVGIRGSIGSASAETPGINQVEN